MGFGFGSEPFGGQQEEDGGGAGWADAFGDDDSSKYPLNFAANPLKEVVNLMTAGSKQKRAGLGVEAAFNYNNEKQQLQLEFKFNNTVIDFGNYNQVNVVYVNRYKRFNVTSFEYTLEPASKGDVVATWVMRVVILMIVTFCCLNIFNKEAGFVQTEDNY